MGELNKDNLNPNNRNYKWKSFMRTNSSQVSMFFAVAICFIIVSFASPYFLTPSNLSNVGVSMATYGILSAGLTVCMLLGGLDLSQMAVMAVTSMIIGLLLRNGIPVALALISALAIGMLAGTINGFIVTQMKIIPMIATIGSQMSYRAIASLTTGGNKIRINNALMDFLAFEKFLGFPVQLWIMLLVFILVYFLMKYTTFGRSVYAIGSNQTASYLSGIKVNRIKMIAYIITGFASGLGGILWTAQMRTAVPTAGVGSEFIPISSVIMGGVGLGGGKGNIVGTFFGVALLTIFSNAMVLLNIQAYYQDLLNGLILILAVFIDTIRGGGYKQ
jgi:ribose transport system permease protein